VHDLVRVVRSGDGALVPGRGLPGRGAWLCATTVAACLELAAKRKAFDRAFKAPVASAAIDAIGDDLVPERTTDAEP
jgi:predicted RNA-binding protein YlxR (DUF448 family)